MGVPTMTFKKKATEPKPFSFEDRDTEMLRRKQEKIQQVLEQEKRDREFKANPMPDLNKPWGLPQKEIASATEVEPFQLLVIAHVIRVQVAT